MRRPYSAGRWNCSVTAGGSHRGTGRDDGRARPCESGGGGIVMTAVDDQVAHGTLVRLRRKRLDDAEADYQWRRDSELARFDAASPLRSSFQDFLVTYTEDIRYPSPFRRVFAIEDLD